MNRSAKHISVDGQIVIRTCANVALKHDKYQDIEVEIETTMYKWMTKNSLQRLRAAVKRESKEQVNENVKGRRGTSRGLKHIDGDVPLCIRNKKQRCMNEIKRN